MNTKQKYVISLIFLTILLTGCTNSDNKSQSLQLTPTSGITIHEPETSEDITETIENETKDEMKEHPTMIAIEDIPEYTTGYVTETIINDSTDDQPNDTPEETADNITEIPPVVTAKEEAFITMLMQAINEEDIEFLKEYIYDNDEIEITIERVTEGLRVQKLLLQNKKLTEFAAYVESGAGVEQNTKLFRLTTVNGLSCKIKINKNENMEAGYQYTGPVLLHGAGIFERVEWYFNAVKEKDVEYIYQYLVNLYQDENAKPFNDTDHNENYEKRARDCINRYEQEFNLESIEIKPIQLSEEYYFYKRYIIIEFLISGKSPSGENLTHNLNGFFEWPLTGVVDTWLE